MSRPSRTSKAVSQVCGILYHTLINLFLRDCAATGKRLGMNRKSVAWTAMAHNRIQATARGAAVLNTRVGRSLAAPDAQRWSDEIEHAYQGW